jgi:hypothetical protein
MSSKSSIIASKVLGSGRARELAQPASRASRREVGDAGIDPSGRPGVERRRGRDVGVLQSSNDGL